MLACVASVSMCGCELLTGRINDPIDLNLTNYTTMPVTLFVNGQEIDTYGSQAQIIPVAEPPPPPPGHAELRTKESGRVLLSLDVKPGDAWHTNPDGNGHSEAANPATFVYLSCGRLDLWSVRPAGGPAPPSSFPPGDCDP